MIITQNDVNNDLNMLAKSIEHTNRPLVSPLQALRISAIWPMICMAAYMIALAWIILTFKVPNDPFFDAVNPYLHYLGVNLAASLLSLIFAMGIMVGLYGPSLAYLSIPKDIRDKSLVIKRLKHVIKRLGIITIACNMLLAVFSLFYPIAICASPLMLVISFLVMQMIVSAEIARYGMSSVMGKLAGMMKKNNTINTH